jgi:RHS repeat-associated protein
VRLTYTYGPSGDLRTRTAGGQTTTYSYDSLGNLMGAWLPDGRVIEYVVDGLNRRVGKKVNGAVVEGFLYDGQLRPIAWLDATGAVKATFVYGLHVNVPEYMTTSAGTFRILTDHLGSPRLVVDASSGAVVQRMDYDSFGQVLADSAPGFQPFGFAGGLWDRDTGLVKFGARDYDPVVGRWTNKDPIRFKGGTTNLYEYVGNDPVNRIDPTGLRDYSGTPFAGGVTNDSGQPIIIIDVDHGTVQELLPGQRTDPGVDWDFVLHGDEFLKVGPHDTSVGPDGSIQNTGWIPSFIDPPGPASPDDLKWLPDWMNKHPGACK